MMLKKKVPSSVAHIIMKKTTTPTKNTTKEDETAILGGDSLLHHLESLTFGQLLQRFRASSLYYHHRLYFLGSDDVTFRRPLNRCRLINMLYYHIRSLNELYGTCHHSISIEKPLKRKRDENSVSQEAQEEEEDTGTNPFQSNILFQQEIAKRRCQRT